MDFSKYQFFHVIDLPDGRATPGVTDHRDQPAFLGIDKPGLFEGKRILDVGANDGFWAFWAEKAGAADVLATDVETYADYDWGFDGPTGITGISNTKADAFSALKDELHSSVRREKGTVYELDPLTHGVFDVVFFYGVLYHLRHPLLAFDVLRKVCGGCIITETHVANRTPFLPMSLFYLGDSFNAPTNWTGPSEACVVHWMRDAGFTEIYRQKVPYSHYVGRQRFIGIVDRSWEHIFAKNSNFARCDQAYFQRCRYEVDRHLGRHQKAVRKLVDRDADKNGSGHTRAKD